MFFFNDPLGNCIFAINSKYPKGQIDAMMYAQLFCETLFNSAERFLMFSMNLIIFSTIKVEIWEFFAHFLPPLVLI